MNDTILHYEEAQRRLLKSAARLEKAAEETEEYLLEFYSIRMADGTPRVDQAEQQDAAEHAQDLLDRWAELDEDIRRLYRRRLEDYGPVEGQVEYLRYRRLAADYRERAYAHHQKLEELRRVKVEYLYNRFP